MGYAFFAFYPASRLRPGIYLFFEMDTFEWGAYNNIWINLLTFLFVIAVDSLDGDMPPPFCIRTTRTLGKQQNTIEPMNGFGRTLDMASQLYCGNIN